jgi:hypothetical protein
MVEVECRLLLARFRVCSISSLISNCWMDNLRPNGSLGRSVEHLEGKDGESVVAISGFLCGSPACVD